MSETPSYIGFEAYTEHVPASIPAAVQQATGKFAGLRSARVAELPQWEQLRQIGSDIRLHTIENMDVYLTRLEEKSARRAGLSTGPPPPRTRAKSSCKSPASTTSNWRSRPNRWRPRKSG